MADRLLGAGSQEPEPTDTVLGGLSTDHLPSAFAAQLVQRLREQDPRVLPALLWLDERLAAQEPPRPTLFMTSNSIMARRM